MRHIMAFGIFIIAVSVMTVNSINMEKSITSMTAQMSKDTSANNNLEEILNNISPELLKTSQDLNLYLESSPILLSSEDSGERILVIGDAFERVGDKINESPELFGVSYDLKLLSNQSYPTVTYRAAYDGEKILTDYTKENHVEEIVEMGTFSTIDIGNVTDMAQGGFKLR